MIELGKKQTLLVVKSVEFGVYLAEDMNADTKHQVLLPAKQVPAGTKAGDKLEVFIYKDSQDWKKIFCFHIMSRQLVSLRGRNVW